MDKFIELSLKEISLDLQPNSLEEHLHSLGVEQPSDVLMLCEADLLGVMKVIQARKLLKYWQSRDTNNIGYVNFVLLDLRWKEAWLCVFS